MQTLQTARRALEFLEIVAAGAEPLRVKAIASRLSLSESTAYHLRNTLLEAGYLSVDAGGGLRLGPRAGVIARGYESQRRPVAHLRSILEGLAATTRETVYLAMLTDEGVVVQDVIESTQAVRVSARHEGAMGLEHRRASGKCVLAYLPEERCLALVERTAGADALTDKRFRTQLDRDLTRVRELGWALDREEFEPGVCCVSAPFFGVDGEVVGALTASAPTNRFDTEREDLVAATVESSREVSRLLGYRA